MKIKVDNSYHHIEKLQSDEVDGLLIGNVYIFPKIDGSNGHLWFDGNEVKIASRNYELSKENQNNGFYDYVLKNDKLLSLARNLGIGKHIYGEWLIPHSLKTYRKDTWRKFYIFDILDTKINEYISFNEYEPILKKFEVDYIPLLRIIKNPHIEDCIKCLEENTFLIEDGNGIGEGIVIKNYDYANKFGRQVWGKIVTSEFKEKHLKEMGAPITNGQNFIEEEIVEKFLTEDIINKVFANIKSECGWSSKQIPRLLQTIYYDFVREQTWDFVKKYKNPKVDFRLLQRFVIQKTKNILGKQIF